jgi:hypothetical protein
LGKKRENEGKKRGEEKRTGRGRRKSRVEGEGVEGDL